MILDGHSSRMSTFGTRILLKYNIYCLVLPSHCTHVLQPFDVSIASPLKSKYISNFIAMMKNNDISGLSDGAKIRLIRVLAFLDAWNSISTSMFQKSFKSAGIFPFDESNIAMKKYVAANGTVEIDRTIRTSPISGKISSDFESLLKPFQSPSIYHGGQNLDLINIPLNAINTLDMIYIWNLKSSEGKIFSEIPPIYVNGVNILKYNANHV